MPFRGHLHDFILGEIREKEKEEEDEEEEHDDLISNDSLRLSLIL